MSPILTNYFIKFAAKVLHNMDRTPILEKYNPLGQLFIFIGLVLLSLVIGVILSAAVIAVMMGTEAIGSNVMSDLSNPNVLATLKTSQLVASITIFILPALLFACLASRDVFRSLSINKKVDSRSIILVVILVVAVLPIVNFTQEINQLMALPDWLSGIEEWMKTQEENSEVVVKAFLSSTGLLALFGNLIVLALIPAIGEELCFRGVMQNIFGKMFKNPHIAIWATAAIFSAIHMQFYGFLPRMLLGAMLGYLYLWSGSLWLAILAHFLNNGFAVFMAYLIGIGSMSQDIEEIGAGEGMWIIVISSMLFSGTLLFGIWKNEHLKKVEITRVD